MTNWYSDLRKRVADFEISLLLRIGAPSGIYGIYGEYAFEPLIKAMNGTNSKMFKRAIDTTVYLGPSALPALVRALELENTNSTQVGPTTYPAPYFKAPEADAISRIMAANPENPEVRKTISELAERLNEENVFARERVVKTIARIGTPMLPTLVEALDYQELEIVQEQTVRANAAEAVGEIAKENPDNPLIVAAVPKLLRMSICGVQYSASRVAWYTPPAQKRSIDALIRIGIHALPQLIAALDDPTIELRGSAAYVIGEIAKANPGNALATSAVPKLIRIMREAAMISVRGRVTSVAVPQPSARGLVKRQMSNPDCAKEAIESIGIPALPALVDAAMEGNENAALRIRKIADSNPGNTDVAAAISKLSRVIENPNASALADFTVGGPMQPALLEGPSMSVWISSKVGISVLPLLVKALYSENEAVRLGAISGIGAITHSYQGNAEIMKTVPRIIELLDDPAAPVLAIMTTLDSIAWTNIRNPEIVRVVPIVATALKRLGDEDSEVRKKAAGALAEIAKNHEIDLEPVGRQLAEYVARVSETGSEPDIIAAKNYAAAAYSQIAAAASQRVWDSEEMMAGEMLRPNIRPITPRGWNQGMLRMQGIGRTQTVGRRQEIARIVVG